MAVVPMIVLCLTACTPCGDPHENRSCVPGLTTDRLHRNFYGIADRNLTGHGYRLMEGTSRIRCVHECHSDPRCFSVNFSDGTVPSLCELNVATATCAPHHLVDWSGVFYYGPEKLEVVEKLCLVVEDVK
ncbi:uncharacterized protein LOC110989781, partial [Acanthaster planci]|uniref:Uncharacterized protein LOC110989781 n=1 Tax=Acanthaster planci TaxID=133434 RepID=A0A8B7ZZD7_ACAPL